MLVGQQPVVGVLVFGGVFEIEEQVAADGDVMVVAGLVFVFAAEIVDVAADAEAAAVRVEVLDLDALGFAGSDAGVDPQGGQQACGVGGRGVEEAVDFGAVR